jgi:hypothetical protein
MAAEAIPPAEGDIIGIILDSADGGGLARRKASDGAARIARLIFKGGG